jgi:signal transduction histidine kinase
MQERASLLGGTLDAGRNGEGFLVRARLPYGGGEEAA